MAMRLEGLDPRAIDKIKAYRWDRIIEKHEGPERWESALEYYDPDFLLVDGHQVLLPIGREHHPNVTVLRCLRADDGSVLTIFLKDMTHVEADDPVDELFSAGYVAICERVAGEDFYLAVVYHEWFVITDNPPPGRP